MGIEKKLIFKCTDCGNCCTNKNTIVNLTYQDILRIRSGLDLNTNETLDIIGFYIINHANYKSDPKKMVISPIETEKGLAFVGLIKNSDGVCFFYDIENSKCSIYDLRPIFCKTFPFTYQLDNVNNLKIYYTEKAKDYCPGINSGAPEIDYTYWSNLGRKVMKVLRSNQIFIKSWNKRVKEKKISPLVKNFINLIIALKKN